MQTFLPYSDFDKCAQVLDPSRLGNQAYREGITLLTGGWHNHPASKMWVNHKRALAEYILACFRELTRRGRHYQHHIDRVTKIRDELPDNGFPPWLGNDKLHSSHRSNLLRKDFEHYSKFGWSESTDIPYFWPSKDLK